MGKELSTSGYYNYTPMFVDVGSSGTIAVSNIVATADQSLEGGVLMLYVLNTNRGFAKSFSWFTTEDRYDEDGWYFGDEEVPTDYTLKPGESLQVRAPFKVNLTYSGEVDQGSYDYTIESSGYYLIGNQHATPMALKDIKAVAGQSLEGGVLMCYDLNTTRGFAKSFSWYTTEDRYDEDNWYFGDEETPTDFTLDPGQVLQCRAPFAMTLKFPAQPLN